MNVASESRSSAVRPSPPAGEAPWRLGFEGLSREHGFLPLRVEGTLPKELRGTFYRNGPGSFGVGGERRASHWFDGDGAVTAVRIEGGAATGATRLVATPWLARERAAGRRLFGGYDTPLVRPIQEILFRDVKNPANTSVMVHQDRLYALCEGGKPFEISQDDLATLGERDLDGIVTKAFSAHPHRVPRRRATYGFGLAIGRKTTVDTYALPDEGRPRRLGSFALDGQRMNHDFAVTARHLVFFFAPFYFSLLRALTGHGLVTGGRWKASRGTEIVVVPIDDPSRIVRFTVPAFCMEHVVNAFERDGGEIVVDYVHYDDLRGLEDYVSGIAGGAPKRGLASTLRRAIVDPARRTFRSEPLLDEPVELPRIDPRAEGSPHCYTYAVSFADALAPPSSILKHDRESGRIDRWAPGDGAYPSEAVFVPREGGGAEDDGFLLTLVLDVRARTSHLAILDAGRMGDGPIARCHFDQAIPFGFHGVWTRKR
jgi:all-trans-8'-apo-beta-carotenal 15,15'-oxygenase